MSTKNTPAIITGKPNNPPAFARPASEYTASGTLADGNVAIPHQDGVSLRDYFAAKAMQGDIASTENFLKPQDVAHRAYLVADAMLAQRAVGGKEAK